MGRSRAFAVSVDTDDAMTFVRRLNRLPKDLRTEENGRLRDAALATSDRLASRLRSSGVGAPQAARVATTARPRRDRLPKVMVGGSKRVTSRGTKAGAILWGSNNGGRNFPGATPWINQSVDRFAQSDAPAAFYAALTQVLRENRLL